MKIFITNLHSRKEMLVANSIAHELNGTIEIFDSINVYDVYLSSSPSDFFVLSDDDYSNIFISKLIDQLLLGGIENKKNRIIFLYKGDECALKHKDIISIPYNVLCHYNEYIDFKIENKGYILCELNCISQKKNAVLENILFPENTSVPVRLVNCPRFDHPQNLGVVNDYDMLKLISCCSVYIGLTDNYIYDAINMKKPTITTVPNKIIPITDHIKLETINNCVFNDLHLAELTKNRISNIIKYKLK